MCILGVAATAERGSLLDKFHHLQGLRWCPVFGYLHASQILPKKRQTAGKLVVS
jgi:hypothetical protein